MKLIKRLTVAGKPYTLVNDEVRLVLSMPGRARFVVQASEKLSGLVVLDVGYADREPHRYFIGYVEESTPVDRAQQALLCRELSAVLRQPMPLNLRHPTLNQVLAAIAEQTGLNFNTPEQAYSRTPVAKYYNLGNGIHALDSLGPVFGINNFIWQQQGSGRVFVGNWQHSHWADRPIQLPQELFTDVQANLSARMPVSPGLRPGVRLNQDFYITQVVMSGNRMTVKWSRRLDG